ncbi:hypothetical protein B0H10DRAFT_1955825 [Mycena sp. CBHHK59/15]|nr:hypothetical protein B0H10DRAFT_1955825 [Mycena sp. CBHHK59/15]
MPGVTTMEKTTAVSDFLNIAMVESRDDMEIQELYTVYLKHPDRALVVGDGKKHKLPKGSSMTWELAIDENRYQKRVDTLFCQDTGSDLGSKKRKSSLDSSIATKRSRTGQTLTSSFSGEDDYSVLAKARPEIRKVKFVTIRCKATGTEGRQVLIGDLDPNDPTGECSLELGDKIEVTTLILSLGDRGRSKDVSKFYIEGHDQVYVAKILFDVGQGRQVVSPALNQTLLSRELIRIGRFSWFYGEFEKIAANKGFTELATVKISDAFLILAHSDEPDIVIDNEDAYLVEPLRTSSVVTKFTGTLGSSAATEKNNINRPGLQSFCLGDDRLLDELCRPPRIAPPRLYGAIDPMTHTIGGLVVLLSNSEKIVSKSGLGDHGSKGIKDTIDSHHCNAFCNALELASTDVLLRSLEARIKEHNNKATGQLVDHGSDSDGAYIVNDNLLANSCLETQQPCASVNCPGTPTLLTLPRHCARPSPLRPWHPTPATTPPWWTQTVDIPHVASLYGRCLNGALTSPIGQSDAGAVPRLSLPLSTHTRPHLTPTRSPISLHQRWPTTRSDEDESHMFARVPSTAMNTRHEAAPMLALKPLSVSFPFSAPAVSHTPQSPQSQSKFCTPPRVCAPHKACTSRCMPTVRQSSDRARHNSKDFGRPRSVTCAVVDTCSPPTRRGTSRALPSLVLARGHRVEQIEEVPLVIASAAESFTKTKETLALLKSLNACRTRGSCTQAKERCATADIAAPRTPRRLQRRQRPRQAFRNLPGVELVNVHQLNLLQLAPGGHLGRFVICTEGAFMLLDEVFGNFDKASTHKKD